MNQQPVKECPKCENSYFTLEIRWMDTYVITQYTCESCNWKILKSNYTSPSNAQAPSCSNQSVVSAQQTP